jgi:outer membrane protein assembly factor BamB
MTTIRATLGLVVMSVLLMEVLARANDWPQWRGPNRDGHSKETGLLKEWPKDGPSAVWQVKDLGGGYSTPSVAGGRLYVMTNKGLADEFVVARDTKDGRLVWSTRIGKVGNPDQQPSYPAARSTPTVDGAALYALGSDGDLVCLETATGKVRWRKSLRADVGGQPGTWAYAESPLVEGDVVVSTPRWKRGNLPGAEQEHRRRRVEDRRARRRQGGVFLDRCRQRGRRAPVRGVHG